ncbi:hypothetical protein [Pedobacter soli]|uniref:Uncharacterized protein n=1 Tax=Pedobacter soli TaxID=390242 RepID=A0A1G6JZI5_9SPHI|nr:hypothetical protein [Pedobacter soli]SDC24038.1 hypothetical protein SAMN04488024_101603 [Pedobacter soli]
MSFKIPSQLSEDQIESDVASYLGYITPFWSKRFRLISVNEASSGADKLFNRFVPIYLQFKVSQGLDPKASILGQILNKPLAKIISYRKSNGLAGDPILYFQLRRQAKTATELQHNLLARMHKPPHQYGLYIAPLTLDLAEYEKLMNQEPRWWHRMWRPFDNQDAEIADSIQAKKIFLGSNPFLRHHISIPAHTDVDTHNHHYSFSKNGSELAWHGGEVLRSDFRLSTMLSSIYEHFETNRENGIRLLPFINYTQNLALEGSPAFDQEDQLRERAQIDYIQNFTRFLKYEHGISLMFLVDTNR